MSPYLTLTTFAEVFVAVISGAVLVLLLVLVAEGLARVWDRYVELPEPYGDNDE